MDLVFDKEEASGLKGVALKDQLRLFKNAGAPNLKQPPLPTKADDIHKALTDAIDLHTNGAWRLVQDEECECESIDLEEVEDVGYIGYKLSRSHVATNMCTYGHAVTHHVTLNLYPFALYRAPSACCSQ